MKVERLFFYGMYTGSLEHFFFVIEKDEIKPFFYIHVLINVPLR